MKRNRHSKMAANLVLSVCLTIAAFANSPLLFAQDDSNFQYDLSLYEAMKWRNIGPFRGGRSTAATGVVGDPLTYYFGSTGGGVWKTQDAGVTWKNISDKFFKTGSVGAIAVAASDPNVIYVGMGEACVRGVTTSHGDGVYKSTDAGKTWTHLGLENTRQVSRIRVHPKDPDLVYVAAQGHLWAPNPERGIYRSSDGGKNWQMVLHVDEKTGANDLSMDMNNPRILYAAMWEHHRKPWKVVSGGPGSGLHKSTDGGDTWEKLTEDLPEMMGKIGVAVSPANSERVWAIVEAEKGGLFRSDDAGESWKLINEKRILRARAWYYTHVFADPQDQETVYVLNAPVMKSVDGGKNFTRISTPHGDNHDLWIDPEGNRRMINANDGGANISFNGGKTWSSQANQPTAQFYRVITDNRFPYYVYGGQQDNSTVAIASRTTDAGIGRDDWYPVGGCESAHVAFDPDNPVLVYAGCYQGQISEYNHETGLARNVMADPYLGLGSDPKDLKYRFNWNAPILTSPHDPSVIYHAGNVLLKSADRGRTWAEISPDLTRDEKEKQGNGGGPITNEAAGAETYNTILYVVESAHAAGTIWAGSDDGLVHITRNGGKVWEEVTPKDIGEAQINSIEVSPHDQGAAYLAVSGYKLDDYTPLIFKTEDYGKKWQKLTDGIPEGAWVRVVREDPQRKGLLYAGTETGIHLSFNDGKQWQPLQLNLPVVPVTDLTIRNNDLVAATQGRAFWILDDLTPLHQINDEVANAAHYLFAPGTAVRMVTGGRSESNLGKNPPDGAILQYYFSEVPDTSAAPLKIEILDASGQVVRMLSSEKKDDDTNSNTRGTKKPKTLPAKKGMNRFVWDLRRDDMTKVPKLFTFGNLQGYRVGPGDYRVRMRLGEFSSTRPLEIVSDPRSEMKPETFKQQQTILTSIWTAINEMHESVARISQVRSQVKNLVKRTKEHEQAESVATAAKALNTKISDWEKQIVQPKQKTFQDVINFPNQLNAQMIYLFGAIDEADPPVTMGAQKRFDHLRSQWEALKAVKDEIMQKDLAAFNQVVQAQGIPAVFIAPKKSKPVEAGTEQD